MQKRPWERIRRWAACTGPLWTAPICARDLCARHLCARGRGPGRVDGLCVRLYGAVEAAQVAPERRGGGHGGRIFVQAQRLAERLHVLGRVRDELARVGRVREGEEYSGVVHGLATHVNVRDPIRVVGKRLALQSDVHESLYAFAVGPSPGVWVLPCEGP
ncbi:hypothetical protein M885DRAFT_525324 [Pelagophyceae sp. CCMP2097]|nr:hypothetical protein M885DRAFT_525324 [Pelagophyceae sp. CCMP2097]